MVQLHARPPVNSHNGPVAQWQSTCFAYRGSGVRIPSGPPTTTVKKRSTKQFLPPLAVASLDGIISVHPRKLPDWNSKEDKRFFRTALAKSDAIIIGRNTYNLAARYLRPKPTFVLSSRPKTLTKKGSTTYFNPKKVSTLELLRPYKRVAVIGGNRVYGHMFKSNLLDEFYLTIEPLVFGKGIPLFSGTAVSKKAGSSP